MFIHILYQVTDHFLGIPAKWIKWAQWVVQFKIMYSLEKNVPDIFTGIKINELFLDLANFS